MSLSKIASKREAIAFAAGLAFGSGGSYAVVDDGKAVEQVVAPVEVGSGELGAKVVESRKTSQADRDNDGVPDQRDMCPWAHGAESNGCPKIK